MTGYGFVFLAACLWGTLGLWFTALDRQGLGSLTIALFRAGLGGTILLMITLWRDRGALRLTRRDVLFFTVYGLIGVALFYTLYVQAVLLTNVPTASVMLYTAPAWVTLYAWRAWGEKLDRNKLFALALAFAGVLLVARLDDPRQLNLNLVGTLVAAGAGLTYAIYTILNKYAVRRHTPAAAVTYSLLFGALFLLPFQWFPLPATMDLVRTGFASLIKGPPVWFPLLAMCLGPTLGAYLLYGSGLTRVPASNASIVATVEPVIAAVLAWLALGQTLEPGQWIGGALILAGAGLLAATR